MIENNDTNELNAFDDLFRQSSEEITENPPQRAWQRVEKRLAANKKNAPRRKMLGIEQFPIVAIILFLLLFAGFIVLYFLKR